MKINKSIFTGLIATFVLALNIPLALAQQNLVISPASGTYLDISQLDLSLIVNVPVVPGSGIQSIKYYVNGALVNEWFKSCMTEGKTIQDYKYFLCKNQAGSSFGVGYHDFRVVVQLQNGIQFENQVNYEIIATRASTSLMLPISANSSLSSTGLELEPMRRYEISANGQISLWPQNYNFPTATPRGNGTTCTNSSCLILGAPTGALVGKVGNGPWFLVKDRFVIDPQQQAYGPGTLFLSVNDHMHQDNLGAFSVTIKAL